MKKVLLTGSQGFIGSYICQDLLEQGYKVVGVDNYSKYGTVVRPHDKHPNFKLFNFDVRNFDTIDGGTCRKLGFWPEAKDADYIIAGAALIGGISYFHAKAFDLLATNEEILASTFRLAIKLHKEQQLKRIVTISSSMVFESTDVYPTPEGEQLKCPPPMSTYGFQKLASEYFCRGAYEQYKLPYSIVRPFNCCGQYEDKALGADEILTGNVKMMLSHVLPDLISRAFQTPSDQPFSILGEGNQVRCYTNGKDIARGIRMIMESDKAENNDFNISHPKPTTVLELAELVWKKIHGTPVKFQHLPPFEYDVQKRVPNVDKAREVLGFEAEVSLEQSVEEVIEWMKKNESR